MNIILLPGVWAGHDNITMHSSPSDPITAHSCRQKMAFTSLGGILP
jgi:hypothetical protein